ncbi:RloB family protein [Streptomyces sp. NPDC003077]|uniref:RloB family protein n=1 Tax=Streptomyces sp. NPDC003077 TaxID=3154443 RepID=UPI0033AE5132
MSTRREGGARRRDRSGGAGRLRRTLGSYGDQSRRVVYVAAEGARTEPDYFRLLNEVYGERGSGKMFRLHVCSPSHANGLRPEAVVEQVPAEADPDCEKWAFFDRDAADCRETAIRKAMRRAAGHGVQVALSHPSFELWLLLHFQPFTSQENGLDGAVVDRLRRHRDAKGFADYDRQSGERGKGVAGERGASLLGREQTAVRNARKLVTDCPHGNCSPKGADIGPIAPVQRDTYERWRRRTGHAAECDPLLRDPSTDVWRLVVALGIADGDA